MRRVLPIGGPVSDTYKIVHYIAPNETGRRFIISGRAGRADGGLAQKAERLFGYFADRFPDLAGVKVSHCWTGRFAITGDWVPHIGVEDGIHYVLGCCGTGIPMATYLGHRVAQKILRQEESESAFERPLPGLTLSRRPNAPAAPRRARLFPARPPVSLSLGGERGMKFVTRREIEALGIDHAALVATLEDAFRASHAGEIIGRPKSTVNQPDGAFFIGALAAWAKRNVGIFHCIMGPPPANLAPGEAHYRTYQLLTDYGRGTPIAMIDGTFTSTMLPAGITAMGARALARPDSRIATIVGAGAAGAGEPRRARRNLPARRDPHSRSLASQCRKFRCARSGTEAFRRAS